LRLLSGGAAQGLIAGLAAQFKTMTGLDIDGEYSAVGAMAAKLQAGDAADMVVLTRAIIADLAGKGLLVAGTVADLGLVETSIAVRSGDPPVRTPDAASLRDALLAAAEIFVPDTKTSTAGIHVAGVLDRLDILDEVAGRLQVYPNGATAMRHLAASHAPRAIGCTQATEIINTPGVRLCDPLPAGYELATVYTAAVTSRSSREADARQLIALLTAAESGASREKAGFLKTYQSRPRSPE
jgi:molybdate transport system substrate-binding protein